MALGWQRIDADIAKLVRNADVLAQRQDPFEEAVEAVPDAEIGSGAHGIEDR